MTDQTTAAGWNFANLAYLWDPRLQAITAGADRLEALPGADRDRSLAALAWRVRELAAGLDDGWLVSTAYFMVDDLHKSYFHGFRWTPGVPDYIAATAGVVLDELTRRGFVLHHVIDNVELAARLDERLTSLPAVFAAAGLKVTGPQLMALTVMERADGHARDVAAIPQYRDEGHHVADLFIERCHRERWHSVYLNLDLDDDAPPLSLETALSPGGTAGTIMMFRNAAPAIGTFVHLMPPPGITLPGPE